MPPVTDPAILQQLNGGGARAPTAMPTQQRAPGILQGPPVVAAPPPAITPYQQIMLDRGERSEARAERTETRTAQERAQGLDATEGERKAAAFLRRAIGSNTSYEGTGVGARGYIAEGLRNVAPDFQNNFVPEWAGGNSPSRQIADTNQDEFIAASLRQDSGAAIPPEEMETQRRIYFPVSGDGSEVIEAKRQARIRAIEGLQASAGRLRDQTMAEINAANPAPAGTRDPVAPMTGGGTGPRLDGPEGPGSGLNFKADGTPFTAADDADFNIPAYDANGEYVLRGRNTDTGPQDPTAEMGILESIGESITGSARSTAEIEALPDWAGMPEMNTLSGDSFMASLGTMMSDPEETALVIQKRFPGVRVRLDGNGNFILRSASDGKEYGIRPGFRMSDIPRAAGAVLSFTPAGRANSLLGAGAATAGTQALVEGTQSAAGGRFDRGDVALAGVAGVGGKLLERGILAATPTVRSAFGQTMPSRNALEASIDAAPVGNALDGAAERPFATRAANAAPERAMPPLRTAAPAQPAPVAAAPTAPAAPVASTEQIAEVARRAVGRNPMKARAARRELAKLAKANPEAAAAAERLGVELPVDVLSDDAQLQALTGLSRSQVGSEAETAWRATLARAAEQSDAAVSALGASDDLAQVSDDVLRRMNGAAETLQRQAAALRVTVDAAIRPGERIESANLQQVLAGMINDFGGLREAKAAMTPVERDLLSMLGEGAESIRPTYARINRLRNEVGEALNKNKGPWVDVPHANLAAYYRALSDDQLAGVIQMGGEEVGVAQRAANTLFSQMYDQRAATQEIFGKQLDKSLAPILRRMVTQGAKGDAREITRVMERIPEDMRGQAVASAILAQSRSSAAHGGFSFSNYAKAFRGVRANGPVYSQITENVGRAGTQVLIDLYAISNRMARAEGNVLKTGKANQGMVNGVNAEGMLSQVFSAAASRTATGAGAAIGGTMAGPGGAAAGATLANSIETALGSAGKTRLDKVHNLITSPEFRAALEASPARTERVVDNLYRNSAFQLFARSVGLSTPAQRREWLRQLSAAGLRDTTRGAFNDNSAVVVNATAQDNQQNNNQLPIDR